MAAKDFWFPFEPKVWLSDSALRGCSKRARAVWMDMICLMHDREVQGVLKDGNQAWSLQRIASSIPGDTTENLTDIGELLTNGVASREEGTGAIVCRMMHRRWLKRTQCSKAGKSGGGNPVFKRNPKHEPKHNDKHPSYCDSDSSSSLPREERVQREKPPPCPIPSIDELVSDELLGVFAQWFGERWNMPHLLCDLASRVEKWGEAMVLKGMRHHMSQGSSGLGNWKYLDKIIAGGCKPRVTSSPGSSDVGAILAELDGEQ